MAADLAQANHWTATWPQSRFLQTAIVTLVLPDGFASLVGIELRIARGGSIEERPWRMPGNGAMSLVSLFGLDLPEADIARLPMFART